MRVIQPHSMFAQFLGYMTNPDEVLRDTGEALSIYRKMKTDARIRSLLPVAKNAVLNFPVRLEAGPASKRVVDLVTTSLESLPIHNIETRLLSAVEYGYAVVEIVWENRDGWWIPVDAVRRRPERFVFGVDGRLMYLRNGERVDLSGQAYKWLVYSHDKEAENPYGTAVLKSCYWPWKFKQAGAEFWLMATEKFSVASILALFEAQGDEEQIRKRAEALSQMLSSMRSGSGAAVANVKEAKVLEASGDISKFVVLLDWCDRQLASAIVYQTLTVTEGVNGTRAQAEVHEGTFLDTSKGTCREIAPVLQRYVDYIVELNFGSGEPSPVVIFDLEDYASWDQVLAAIENSVPVSRTSLYARYGLPKPVDEADSFVKPVSAGGALFADDEKKKRRPLLIRQSSKRS